MSQMQQSLAHRRWRRPRLLLALLGLLVTGMAALGYWHFRPRQEVPSPPEVDLKGAEPAVVRVIQRAREEVVQQPTSAAAWGRLGEVLLANAHDPEALECLAQAERLDPRSPRWPHLRASRLLVTQQGSALPPLRRAVELCDEVDPVNTAPRMLLIQTLIEKGEYAEAKSNLQRVLEREPDSAPAHFCLGLAALAERKYTESRDHFLRAADSPFTHKKACAYLTTVYQHLEQYGRAEEYARLERAASQDRPWPDPYLQEANRFNRGRQARFLEAERLDSEGKLHEAIRILAGVADDYPDGRSYVALGVALAKINDTEAAEPVLRKAVRLAPDQMNARYALAVVLVRQGDRLKEQNNVDGARVKYREAEAEARRGLALKPDHAFCHVHLGLALKGLGKLPEAIESLRTAVRCSPELVDAHLYLGEALLEADKREDGLKCLQTAVELAPAQDSRPREALSRARGKEK